jgi:hypothetical protein
MHIPLQVFHQYSLFDEMDAFGLSAETIQKGMKIASENISTHVLTQLWIAPSR